MPRRKQPKPTTCQRCEQVFLNEWTTGVTCPDCKAAPKFSGPPCKCGCGEKTAWQPGKGWSEYRHGHLIRDKRPPHPKEMDPNWRPWNFGNDARQDCVCQTCGVRFKEHYAAKFCGIKCRDAPKRKETRLQKGRDGMTYRYARDENDKWKAEHRLVMERHLGKKLEPGQIIHHKNEDPLCNDLANLFVMHCQACHLSHHAGKRPLQYKYDDIHSDSYVRAKAKRKAKRFCRVCTVEFRATIGNQNRCLSCMNDEAKHAPLCECGCGQKTAYRNDVGYAKFVRGHHARVNNPNTKQMCQHDSADVIGDGLWCTDCGCLNADGHEWRKPRKLVDAIANMKRRGTRVRTKDGTSASPNANPTR